MQINISLNGQQLAIIVAPGETLLEVLRDQGYFGAKHGCDHGECGACTVLIDDKAVNSCLVLAHSADGKKVETIEGLGDHEQLHPLQEKFIASGAIQCGFCTPAMILALEALSRETTEPTEAQVRDALSGILCRCTGYVKPVEAAL